MQFSIVERERERFELGCPSELGLCLNIKGKHPFFKYCKINHVLKSKGRLNQDHTNRFS